MKTKNIEIGKVYETTEYSQFKLSTRNRHIVLRPKQAKDFELNGIISPVIVNEDMVIIDGQHRFAWSKKENKPVKFIIVEGLNEEHIVSMNTTQIKWGIMDYIASFANDGNEEYKKLFNFMKYHPANRTTIIAILYGDIATARIRKVVESGAFKFFNTTVTIKFLSELDDLFDKTGVRKKGNLILGIWNLYRYKKFDIERLKNKILETNSNEKLSFFSGRENGTLTEILDIYNHKLSANSKKYIDYSIDSKGKLKIAGEFHEWVKK